MLRFNKIKIILVICLAWPLLSSTSQAATTINAQIIRNQVGTGNCQISNGFPFPKGLVTEDMIREGTIRVLIDGSDIAANITALRGRHSDGTIRSALIQFTRTMTQNDVAAAQIVIGNGARPDPDPVYINPTFEMVQANNIIIPTDPNYITTTDFTYRHLLPVGAGSGEEEKLYTTLVEHIIPYLPPTDSGTARYEGPYAVLEYWVRSGNADYWNLALQMNIIDGTSSAGQTLTLVPGVSCTVPTLLAQANPEGIAGGGSCGQPNEQNRPLVLSLATAYSMTGYGPFWTSLSFHIQQAQKTIINYATAITATVALNQGYDTPRWNYINYQAMLAGYPVAATFPAYAYDTSGKILNFEERLGWTLSALVDTAWDLKWIPFENGTGNTPVLGTTITQGSVSATYLGMYTRKYDSRRRDGDPMSSTGYIQVKDVTGGSFSAGALSGISATATGPEELDYRQGMSGTKSSSQRAPNTGTVTGSVTGTTMTVTALASPTVTVDIGDNISGAGIVGGPFIVSQDSGDPNGVGVYQISESQSPTGSITITVDTIIPVFQLIFINNYLIDYYLYVYADPRIPAMVKANTDIILNNTELLIPGDMYYGHGNDIWGYSLYGQPYQLENPIPHGSLPYSLPEYARSVAFTLKTSGEDIVNGANYTTWYNRIIDTGNINPDSGGTLSADSWTWKNFGQFYAWGQDAPWIMAQNSLLGESVIVEPIRYDTIPGEIPDVQRISDSVPPNIPINLNVY